MKRTEEQIFLLSLVESGNLTIEPASNFSLDTRTDYKKISNPSVMAAASQLTSIASSVSMNGMYVVRFPKGITGTLTELSQGGFSTAIKNSAGKFAGSASLFSAQTYATIFSAFTAMAIVSGQFFLTRINSEMKLINQKIDAVLGFLYGDKKAELISEIMFIQQAVLDFESIMRHDEHRMATLKSIQDSIKVSIKDLEFYIRDLETATDKEFQNDKTVVDVATEVLQICDSLNASLQLYITARILEICYSQNTDESYIDRTKSDISAYIDKCHTRLLSQISKLLGRIDTYKTSKKFDKAQIVKSLTNITDSLHKGKTLEMQRTVSYYLDELSKEQAFIITENGELYYEA